MSLINKIIQYLKNKSERRFKESLTKDDLVYKYV